MPNTLGRNVNYALNSYKDELLNTRNSFINNEITYKCQYNSGRKTLKTASSKKRPMHCVYIEWNNYL